MPIPPAAPPLSLYIHLPWCVRKCPYCDFNSHAAKRELPAQAYVDALLRDLDQEAAAAGGRQIESIFIGGGTPSLFPPEQIDRLLKAVKSRLEVAADAEITLEANPGTVEQARFEGFGAAGVNRLSIGIQSFQDAQLQRLGRIHDGAEAIAAARAARAAGFDNFNLDLMFGLPEQDLAAAARDLEQAIALQPTHISYYQLTIEPNTVFHSRPPLLPPEDSICDIQLAGQALLAHHGYEQYEVSAYARPQRRCRHNLNYWQFGDYLAIGAGAHGKLSDSQGIRRYWKTRLPESYMSRAGSGACLAGERRLTAPDAVLEFAMNALRLNEGFGTELWLSRTGLPLETLQPYIAQGTQRGLLIFEHGRLYPSEQGRQYLDELLQLFL